MGWERGRVTSQPASQKAAVFFVLEVCSNWLGGGEEKRDLLHRGESQKSRATLSFFHLQNLFRKYWPVKRGGKKERGKRRSSK